MRGRKRNRRRYTQIVKQNDRSLRQLPPLMSNCLVFLKSAGFISFFFLSLFHSLGMVGWVVGLSVCLLGQYQLFQLFPTKTFCVEMLKQFVVHVPPSFGEQPTFYLFLAAWSFPQLSLALSIVFRIRRWYGSNKTPSPKLYFQILLSILNTFHLLVYVCQLHSSYRTTSA